MAIKFKVQDGKKYVWDTFANKWSYRGAVPYPIEEGEYKDTLPPPPKGAKASQVPELSEVLSAPYQAAMAGVTKLGEAISRPAMNIGIGATQGIKEASQEQFPKREEGTMYAPTAGEKLMTEGQRLARSVMDVSPPVAQAPQEPKVQINPPMAPSPKPSISVTPPSEEEAAARRYNVMDITRMESVLSEMEARDKARDTIIEKNPWLGGGFTAKLDIPSPAEAARLEGSQVVRPRPMAVKLPQSDVSKWAEDEASAYSGTKIASKETMDAIRAQEPQDASKITVTETAEKPSLLTVSNPDTIAQERRPGASAYAEEYKKRYQKALAGNYGTI